MTHDLKERLQEALAIRQPLIDELGADTDCYRLFHGATEGSAGLAVDRYGPQLLVQTWQEALAADELDLIVGVFATVFEDEPLVVYNHRGTGRTPAFHHPTEEALAPAKCRELGVKYRVLGRHQGKDPLLFLDFRVVRRWLLHNARSKSVLNTFAYTCGAGVCAALGGATTVWNVDFARSATDIGAENALLNGIVPRNADGTPQGEGEAEGTASDFRIVVENFFPIVWQLGGRTLKGRAARRRRYLRVDQRVFDIVVLDPPRWAKTPWGAVDVVRDYQSLLKPCLLATASGGTVLSTNHVPGVSLDEWMDQLNRCAVKAGRPIVGLDVLEPEPDFPSDDGQHPLKIAVLRL